VEMLEMHAFNFPSIKATASFIFLLNLKIIYIFLFLPLNNNVNYYPFKINNDMNYE